MPARIHLNPKLPVDFFDTPHGDRSKEQLAEWWGKPYGISNPDGTITVYCLNDAALDRPSVLGTAESFEAACHLAAEKQTTIGYDVDHIALQRHQAQACGPAGAAASA